MAVIADLYIGATHCIVRDDFCCKPEEKQAILDRISKKAAIAIRASLNKKQEDKTA